MLIENVKEILGVSYGLINVSFRMSRNMYTVQYIHIHNLWVAPYDVVKEVRKKSIKSRITCQVAEGGATSTTRRVMLIRRKK